MPQVGSVDCCMMQPHEMYYVHSKDIVENIVLDPSQNCVGCQEVQGQSNGLSEAWDMQKTPEYVFNA